MQFIFTVLQPCEIKKFSGFLLPSAAQLLNAPQSCGWSVETSDGTPLGCLVAWNETGCSYLRSLFIDENFRRRHLATELCTLWQRHALKQGIKTLHCLVSLPQKEQEIFSAFLRRQNFPAGKFTGEVFTFNPYTIISSRFIRKTFKRSSPYVPASWRVVRYSELSCQDRQLLEQSKGTLFPNYFAYDLQFSELEHHQSFAFFENDTVVGYISQTRLTRNIASVPVFAANPDYRGSGLIILKYYMFALHFETPEIWQLRCHFTPLTTTGRKLFLLYTENKFSRHTLEFYFSKNL